MKRFPRIDTFRSWRRTFSSMCHGVGVGLRLIISWYFWNIALSVAETAGFLLFPCGYFWQIWLWICKRQDKKTIGEEEKKNEMSWNVCLLENSSPNNILPRWRAVITTCRSPHRIALRPHNTMGVWSFAHTNRAVQCEQLQNFPLSPPHMYAGRDSITQWSEIPIRSVLSMWKWPRKKTPVPFPRFDNHVCRDSHAMLICNWLFRKCLNGARKGKAKQRKGKERNRWEYVLRTLPSKIWPTSKKTVPYITVDAWLRGALHSYIPRVFSWLMTCEIYYCLFANWLVTMWGVTIHADR